MRLYVQYVRPHLEFAIPAWAPWTGNDIEKLENVQKKAVRMISGLVGKTYEERLAEIGLPTLVDRRREYDMVQTYKILSGKDMVEAEQWFTLANERTGGVSTRQRTGTRNITPKFGRTEIRSNFFSVRVTNEWNKLPDALKESKSTGQFKHGYRMMKKD